MAALYAATYPERTRALVLFHPFAYRPEGQSEFWQARLAELRQRWGTQELSDEMLQDTAPVLYADRRFPTASGRVNLLADLAPDAEADADPAFSSQWPLWLLSISTERSRP